jgi:hypothetical protein
MVTSFDTDDILYKTLAASEELTDAISGGIYTESERPDNSENEDITVNTITVTNNMPQQGTSNVNIYVPDLKLKIEGQEQRKANRERLRQLTNLIISVLENTQIEGFTFWVSNQNVIKEQGIYQHYTNLRIEWNIVKQFKNL